MNEQPPDQRRHRAAMRIIDRVCSEQDREYCRAVPQAAQKIVEGFGWIWNSYDYVRMPGPHDEGEEEA